VLAAGAGWAVVNLRVARPRRLVAQPYLVDRVEPELGGAATVHLRAHGHAGRLFEPGQFAWIKPAADPLSLAEHPFSYSSSAEVPERPSFTIKPYAGFSARAASLEPGALMLVDGPHGSFRLDPAAAGALLVAGGIGITPCMSVLRTASDRGEQRPYVLVYANRALEDATFHDELQRLRADLDLAVVYVLSRPAAGWTGERGYVDRALLARHLPDDVRAWDFFICGPPLMADGALGALIGLGLPAERVHVERFVAV
jgi:predicted ferric reductase